MRTKWLKMIRQTATWLVFLLLLQGSWPSLAQTPSLQSQRAAFQRAWQALGRSDWNTANTEARALADYPLLPYLRGEQMRQRPDAFSEAEIRAYLQRYADWSFAASLRNSWLRWLGRTGQYELLLEQADNPSDDLLRCYIAHGQMVLRGSQAEHRAELIQAIQALWLSARSLPKQCDAAFTWLEKAGGITPALAWQRVSRAMDADQAGLAGYLRRYLNAADRAWLQRWLALRNRRVATLRSARQWPDEPRAWQIAAWGLSRQARSDATAGLALWQALDQHFSWPASISMPPLHSMGVFHALDLERDALQTIDSVSSEFQDQQLLDWRARVALANGLWDELQSSILRMSGEGQQDERWRYWLARSLQHRGQQPGAQALLAELAEQASYYGFLAADWLDQSYRICPATSQPNADIDQLPNQALIERALELFQVGLESHAYRTWRNAQNGLDDQQRLDAAQLAADAGWLQQSIFTLNDAGQRQQYALRFPVAYANELAQQTQNRGLDTALVHGLIRAESAWHPGAVSSAGARGLMQVTPDTARRLAGQHGLRYRGSASLLEPETNIQFGTANLARLLAQFGSDPVAVLAAYNAGPHVQTRWQNTRPANPPDIWIETLPYFETRDYIPRVLAFSVVYDWRLDGSAQPISQRMPGMTALTNVQTGQRAVNCTVNTINESGG